MRGIRGAIARLVTAAGVVSAAAAAQTTPPVSATIDINTAVTTPIGPAFSGVSADLGLPVEYFDYRFNTLAASLGFGWVRFPGGTSSDIYDWQAGEDNLSWYAEFPGNSGVGGDTATPELVAGRGGARLIDAANRANFLGAPLIICVNGFTDSVDSAQKLATFVKANNIQVAAWELSNEPYLYNTFFPTAASYLNAMRPFRDAIKSVLPDAIVSIFLTDQGHASAPADKWNTAVAAYPNKYWDAVSFHHYPPASMNGFPQWMADENAVLATLTGAPLIDRLTSMGPPGVKFLNTEFDPSIPNNNGATPSLTCKTLYGGIYSAEYIMRMSTVPSVLHVGPSEISYNAGVLASNGHQGQVEAAAAAGTTVNTLNLNFGFFLSAQGVGTSIVNGVINNAVEANQTAVTGGATVAATGMANIPALYAMSYTNGQGGMSVVITNKSATAHQVTVRVNGTAASGNFALAFVTNSDASTENTSAEANAIAVETASSANPIPVPPYSVLRADIVVPAVARIVHSASYQAGPVAPNELVAAFGSGFASQAVVASVEPLPLTLGDSSISIVDSKGNVNAAPLYYVSPSQASFLIPSSAAAGAATVKFMRSGNTVLTGPIEIASVAPGLYAENANGAGVAAAFALDISASLTVTPLTVFSCLAGVAFSCLSTPIGLGSATDTVYLALFGTGIRNAVNVQAYIAGQPAVVAFAGAQGQFDGLDQVNAAIPRSLASSGEVSVYVVADGKISNMVTVKLQ